MRIGFDASPLQHPHPRGIVRITERTLKALEERARLEVVRLAPPPGTDLRRWRQSELPRAIKRQELFGIHSFVSAFAWRGPGKRVHTVHELPWRHGVLENAGWRHKFWARFGVRRADATVTATEFVARDLDRPLAPDGGKLHVVPWGVGSEFQEEPPAGVVDEVVLGRYRLPEGHLALCIGAVRAKKNLAALLRGLARLRDRQGPRLQVCITGPDTPDLRRDLGLASQLGLARWISTPGPVEDEHLPSLLRLAALVPVLSKSEGFGLPVLEAMASGTPVVVARDSAQAEVAGPDGIAVDPGDPDSVADGLERAIATREDLRYVLPDRAREFPFSRTAEGLERVWESLG